MERAADAEGRSGASRGLTLFALLLAVLFGALPSVPLAAPARDNLAATRDRMVDSDERDDGERTEPVAHKPAAAARRSGSLEDDDGVAGAPAVSLAGPTPLIALGVPSDAGLRSPTESDAPRSRDACSPRSSRGPPARG